jgi:hypothetical protein
VCRVLPLSIAAPVLALLLCRGCSGLPWGRCPGAPLAPLLAVSGPLATCFYGHGSLAPGWGAAVGSWQVVWSPVLASAAAVPKIK